MKEKRLSTVRRCVHCGQARATLPYVNGKIKGLWIHERCAKALRSANDLDQSIKAVVRIHKKLAD